MATIKLTVSYITILFIVLQTKRADPDKMMQNTASAQSLFVLLSKINPNSSPYYYLDQSDIINKSGCNKIIYECLCIDEFIKRVGEKR